MSTPWMPMLTHSIAVTFSTASDQHATDSVCPLSPPELGLARVRHLDWPKSSRLDFGWGGGAERVRCLASANSRSLCSRSRPEVGRRDRRARRRCGGTGERDAALLQAIDVVCRRERLHDVLLDDDE